MPSSGRGGTGPSPPQPRRQPRSAGPGPPAGAHPLTARPGPCAAAAPPAGPARTHIGSSNLASHDLRASTFSMIMVTPLHRPAPLYTAAIAPLQPLAPAPSPPRPTTGTSRQPTTHPAGHSRGGTRAPLTNQMAELALHEPIVAAKSPWRRSVENQQARSSEHMNSGATSLGVLLKGPRASRPASPPSWRPPATRRELGGAGGFLLFSPFPKFPRG